MRRDEFRDAIRWAAEITGDRDLVVLGSQSLHGSFNMALLQDHHFLTFSMEIDVLTADDPDGDKIWALSARGGLHSGAEIDGVDIRTSALPEGWVDRLVAFPLDDTPAGVIAWCLEPHDLLVARAIAGRDKDRSFIRAAVAAALVDPVESLRRSAHLDAGCYVPTPEALEAAQFFLASLRNPSRLYKGAARKVPKDRTRPRRDQFIEPPDMFADLRPERPEPS
ncbi:MAG: DUF6036 family nucleotidyltransferase [Acidimicrobiales bacterium]